MKFKDFEQLVLQKYPTAKLFKHGEFSGSKINVGIIFDATHPLGGKVYQYQGTYCYVLNKLGIKAIYSHDVWNIEQALARCKELHGTVGLFGDIEDYTEEIQTYEKQLQDIYSNFVIVR